jgi:hypothetical protein
MTTGLFVRAHAAALALIALSTSCRMADIVASVPNSDGGNGPASQGAPDGGGPGFGFVVPEAGAYPDTPIPGSCLNLQCQQRACPGSATTSLSGTVYAPNGTLPLYNVAVYVPNAPLDPLVLGATCDRCGTLASGKPIASALTDAEGKFKVSNVPAGRDIPLVLQVGKWRRKLVIPEVRPCQDNPLTDPQQTRLPRNRTEGDLPRVAVTDGSCDELVCLLPTLGIDPAELGVAGQDRAFIYYGGGGITTATLAGITDANTLWRNLDELRKYDMVINSCRCEEKAKEKGPMAFEAVTGYLNAGGRMFTTHYSYDFLKFSPDPALRAAVAPAETDAAHEGPIVLDTSFPKGKALADWMKFLDPSLLYGQVPARVVFGNMTGASAQVWGRAGKQPGFLTMNTPVAAPADQQCGRIAHLDLHVTGTDQSFGNPSNHGPFGGNQGPFPAGCPATLNKAEHVLAFFLFDLAACIQEDKTPPAPPPIQ